jgi:SAM-dependent MidA family methyltransferase
VPSAAESITAAITAAGGAISFEQYMGLALYGTGGFYQDGGKAGRRGDFITSPEVGPLFAAVIARYLDNCWNEMGCPGSFDVVEVGAGPGTLARGIFDAQPQCLSAMKYVAVEISESQRALHPDFVESLEVLPDRTIQGVILANELLDNLPFKLFVYDGEWMEAFVGLGDGGKFVEILRQVDVIPDFLPKTAPLGSRAPIQTAASQWLMNMSQKLSRGRVLVFDYCSESTSEIAVSPWREWLRTYKDHERGAHYLLQPGTQDITTQVMIDQLVKAVPELSVTQQSDWLHKWGIDELVSEGSRFWEEHKSAPDIAAMKMRSRVNETQALTDRDGLGAFSVLELNFLPIVFRAGW